MTVLSDQSEVAKGLLSLLEKFMVRNFGRRRDDLFCWRKLVREYVFRVTEDGVRVVGSVRVAIWGGNSCFRARR